MRDNSYFSQFDDKVDEEFNKAVEEAEKENGEKKFEELPDGKYEVVISDMIIKKSKKDEWMLQVTFKVIQGQYEKRLAWAYFLLRPQNVHFANVFLRSLESGIDVKYHTQKQYAELIDNILITITGSKEYGLEIKTNDKGFRNYKIIKVFDVKQDDEVPFT